MCRECRIKETNRDRLSLIHKESRIKRGKRNRSTQQQKAKRGQAKVVCCNVATNQKQERITARHATKNRKKKNVVFAVLGPTYLPTYTQTHTHIHIPRQSVSLYIRTQ